MPDSRHHDLARKIALVLSPEERAALATLQGRLARVLGRKWEVFAELLELRTALTSGRHSEEAVELDDFRPGDTLRLGSALVRTDSRLVLAERLHIGAWADLLADLAVAVVQAPDLARQGVLATLADLDHSSLRRLAGHLGSAEADTDEFPVQPSLASTISPGDAD